MDYKEIAKCKSFLRERKFSSGLEILVRGHSRRISYWTDLHPHLLTQCVEHMAVVSMVPIAQVLVQSVKPEMVSTIQQTRRWV